MKELAACFLGGNGSAAYSLYRLTSSPVYITD